MFAIALLAVHAMAPTSRAAECEGSPSFPTEAFIDANCDGCFDPLDGDQIGITDQLLGTFVGASGECLYVPSTAAITASRDVYLQWTIDGAVHLLGRIQAGVVDVTANGPINVAGRIKATYSWIDLETSDSSAGGAIILADETQLSAKEPLTLRARGTGTTSPPSVSIGRGAKLQSRRFGLRISAAKDVVVGDEVKMVSRDGKVGADLRMSVGFGGMIDIGRKVKITSKGKYYSSGASGSEPRGIVLIDGSLSCSIGEGSKISTIEDIRVSGGTVNVASRVRLKTRAGVGFADGVVLNGFQELHVEEAALFGDEATIRAGDLVEFVSSRLAGPQFSFWTIETQNPGGTCDLTGSVFKGDDPTISCDNVIGP